MDWKMVVKKSIRLLKTASPPTKREFEKILKITLIISLLLGFFGLLIEFILRVV